MLVVRPLVSKNRDTAACSSSDAAGDVVYVVSDKVGADYVVTKADTGQTLKMPGVAVIIAKLTSTRCIIQFEGEVAGQYSGLSPGRVYFVGADARPSLTPPAPGIGAKAYWQVLGVAVDSSVLRLDLVKDMKVRIG